MFGRVDREYVPGSGGMTRNTFWKVIWQYVSRDFKLFRFIALRAPLQEIYSKGIIQRPTNALNIVL